jgi:hypothetical protein
MNQQYSVLFYSQYSPNCKRILNLIENSKIDFTLLFNLTNVCIDNAEIRNRILKSTNIKINNVPCLLTIYPDGGVEKYEGSHTFNWFEEIIDKYNKINLKQNEIPTSTISFNTPPIQAQSIQPQPIQASNQPIQAQSIQPPIKAQTQPIQSQPTRQPQPVSKLKTIIETDDNEDITYEEIENYKEEEDLPVNIKKPPKGIRTDSGNYEIGVDFGSYEEPTREIKKGIKSSTQAVSNTKSDILSAAQALQKSREMDMESSRPPGLSTEL